MFEEFFCALKPVLKSTKIKEVRYLLKQMGGKRNQGSES